MPRSFFSRVFLQSVLVLLALVATGGLVLDRFLAQSEIDRLGDQVGLFAAMMREDASRCAVETELQPLVRRLGEATKVRFTIVRNDGKVLADSQLDPNVMENHASHPEVAQALAGREGRNLRRSASLGIDMLYVALPGERINRAALPVSEVHAVIAEVRTRMALAALPAVGVALLLAYALARALTRRVERMQRFALAIERGQETAELHPEGDDELADMERSLVALRDAIGRQLLELRHDKEVLSGLVEGFPHAVLLFDARRNLKLANAPARDLLRLPWPQAAGLAAGEVIRHPRVLDALASIKAGALDPEPFRLEWIDPSSQLEVSVHALPGENDIPEFLVILRDITREVHLERVRSDFIVNLSHELRTPLTAIRGSAETLQGGAHADSAASAKFLESIRRNTLRLESLLKDLSDLSRAEASADPVKPVSFDAREPVRHVVDLFAAEAENHGIKLNYRLPEHPVPLCSDPEKTEQILVNLVQNGVRYTKAGGRVEVRVNSTEDGALFAVDDTGIGIPPEALPRVTERFYRVDPGRSRAMGGTGLGLAIVKHLSESLGGKLRIMSDYGKGTSIEVFVPAYRLSDSEITQKRHSVDK